MVFSSLSFIFAFFTATMLFYFICPNLVWRNGVLLVFSLIFYAWGEPKLVILMLVVALVAFLGGLAIDNLKDKGRQKRKTRKLVYVLTVALIVANLMIFKYLGFFAENINAIAGLNLNVKITLPIGISFYTFQILSYVIDLYRGEVQVQKNYLRLLLYVAFFPQLIAGPIVRYSTIEEELSSRKSSVDDVAAGLRRFIVGLSKKVLLSNGLAAISEMIYAGKRELYGAGFYWVAAVCYAFQIYFDFSGYSDMAIGLGRIFGFHFLENFDHPYTALSVTDFWRKWHISLSTWFRDYIYIPMGGNRVSKGRWVFNIFVVWMLTGFWHGASWNFVIWGLYYGFFLVLEKLFLGKILEKLPKFIRWIYAAFLVVIGWVIFNITDLNQMLTALQTMFTVPTAGIPEIVAADSAILKVLIYLPLGIIFMLPVGKWLDVLCTKDGETTAAGYAIKNIICLVLLILSVAFLISNKFNPFIYFRF